MAWDGSYDDNVRFLACTGSSVDLQTREALATGTTSGNMGWNNWLMWTRWDR